jgi:hypothetical protein
MISEIKDFLIVKDNFFEKKVYDEILKDISTLKFTNRNTYVPNKNVYQQTYFNVPLNKNHFAVIEVLKILKEYGLNLKLWESVYFLSSKHKKPTPHDDATDLNCLVYLKGKELVNSGTGFYDKTGDTYKLNRHVGFKENRAIIFDSKIFHSSLQFNEDAGSRYVMANFLYYKND